MKAVADFLTFQHMLIFFLRLAECSLQKKLFTHRFARRANIFYSKNIKRVKVDITVAEMILQAPEAYFNGENREKASHYL